MNNPTLISLAVGTLVLMNASDVLVPTAYGADSLGVGATQRVRNTEAKGAQALMELQTRRSAEQRLPAETEVPAFAPLVAKWAELPKQTFVVPTVYSNVPAGVAVHEINRGASTTVYVCVHGIFSEGKDWRYLAGALNGESEMWLVDLPGCGASECLEPKRIGRGGYSTRALADRVLQALEGRLAARPQVSRLVLVGHSMGGMVVLRMFVDDAVRQNHAAVLSRVDGLTLFAPGDVVVTQATETWWSFLGIDPVKARIGSMLQILQSKVARSVQDGFVNPEWASRELAEEGVHLLQDGAHRRAMQQIMVEAVPWRTFGKQVDWAAVRPLEAGYRNVTVPCLLVWGKCDQTLPEPIGHKLNDQLPNARLVLLADTMHMIPLERPELCADLLRQFRQQLDRGDLAAARSIETLELSSEGRGLVAAQLSAQAAAN